MKDRAVINRHAFEALSQLTGYTAKEMLWAIVNYQLTEEDNDSAHSFSDPETALYNIIKRPFTIEDGD